VTYSYFGFFFLIFFYSFEQLPSIDFDSFPPTGQTNDHNSSNNMFLDNYLSVKNNLAGKELSRAKRGSANNGLSSFDHAAASVVPPTKYLSSFDSAYFPSSSSTSINDDNVAGSSLPIFPAPSVNTPVPNNELLSDNASYHSDRVTLLSEGSDGETGTSANSRKGGNTISSSSSSGSSSRKVNNDAKVVVNFFPASSFPSSSNSYDGEMTIGGERRATKRMLPVPQGSLSIASPFDDNNKRRKLSDNFNETSGTSVFPLPPTSANSGLSKLSRFAWLSFFMFLVDNSRDISHINDHPLGPPLSSVSSSSIPPEELQFIDLLHRNQDVRFFTFNTSPFVIFLVFSSM
jgi:hypothetical protein